MKKQRTTEKSATPQEASSIDKANNAHMSYLKGNELLGSNRSLDALAAYDASIELKADFAFGHLGRGAALCRLEHFQEALVSQN